MKKILQISKFYYPKIGGVERIVYQIGEELNKDSDFLVDVLCCGKRGGIEKVNQTKVWRAKTLWNFLGMPLSFDFLKTFRRIRNNYQILDFHQPFPLADLALFLFPARAKIVVHYHSDIVRQRFFKIFVEPFILNTLKKAEKIIVSNPNLVKTSPTLRKFQEKCVVIPFGVEISKFQNVDIKAVEKIRKKYGKFVLFVGRLSYYKGIEYLIRTMKDIPANLLIIGEGQEGNKLKNLVKKLKVAERVFFLPFQPEEKLIQFYHACSVFVLPSIYRSEAFGIVLIEAMACGKPVISTEIGTGTSWVNQHKKTGLVVKPKDVTGLKRAIKEILGNQKIRQEYGRNALERAKEFFSLRGMIAKTKEIYRVL
ncbi:glycosyltransferase [bacterium]|nr:glycosyltransferase [bacterium]